MKQHNVLQAELAQLVEQHGLERVIDMLGDVADTHAQRLARSTPSGRAAGLTALQLWGAARGLNVPRA